jgi:hypothetical protein
MSVKGFSMKKRYLAEQIVEVLRDVAACSKQDHWLLVHSSDNNLLITRAYVSTLG